jgi:hypothetical protein
MGDAVLVDPGLVGGLASPRENVNDPPVDHGDADNSPPDLGECGC